MLAPSGRVEQPGHQRLIGLGRGVVDERLDELGVGRQAGQVEAQPAGERPAVGLGGRVQAVLLELRQHEAVDRVADPRRVLDLRQGRPLRGDQRPVRLILGALGDPAPQHRPSAAAVSVLVVFGGGISSLGSSALIRAISSLDSGSLGAMAPASMAASRRSSRRSALRAALSGPWQAKQFSARIGRMSRLYSSPGRSRRRPSPCRRGRPGPRPRGDPGRRISARAATQAVASTQLPGSVGHGPQAGSRRRPWMPPAEAPRIDNRGCGRNPPVGWVAGPAREHDRRSSTGQAYQPRLSTRRVPAGNRPADNGLEPDTHRPIAGAAARPTGQSRKPPTPSRSSAS